MADQVTSLSKSLQEQIRRHCEEGYQQYDAGDFKKAIRCFFTAWTLLPKPQTQWQEACWVLTALGDAYFKKGDYRNACEALSSALHCPTAEGNPFIHLRLGQSFFEQGLQNEAREQFQLVTQHRGGALLEAENNRYLDCLLSPSPS